MQAWENRVKIWDPSLYRKKNLTFWPKNHPVLFPNVHTDHWTKMKTRVPSHVVSLPATIMMEKDLSVVSPSPKGHRIIQGSSGEHLPVLEPVVLEIPRKQLHGQKAFGASPCGRVSPQNLPLYRNEYNDRARRGFCYWLIEKRIPKSYGYSFGAYKSFLGLPRV
ncbi:hypothetical protein AGOR_G00136630 [Albula goreensis]|uniref:Uncharacterized protein n=1 Tax=Albula goreensis TaxID=1534307 RepID=A0A8T3DCT3_9TELE|nr:hypothetical protein AGOR_G00136630 [Albula goreensis]